MKPTKKTALGSSGCCQHPKEEIRTLGPDYLWCEKCGAVRRLKWAHSEWANPQVTVAGSELIDYLRTHAGDSADWPIEIIADDDGVTGPELQSRLSRLEWAVI